MPTRQIVAEFPYGSKSCKVVDIPAYVAPGDNIYIECVSCADLHVRHLCCYIDLPLKVLVYDEYKYRTSTQAAIVTTEPLSFSKRTY